MSDTWEEALLKQLDEANTEIKRLRAVVERMDEIDQAEVTHLRTEIETLRALGREACALVDGLANQQAMDDDWYVAPLAELRRRFA